MSEARTRDHVSAESRRRGGIRLGIQANPRRFTLLVLQVAFVGALWGIERTVLPVLARTEYGIASNTAALTFILAFGLAKAPANYLAGLLTDRFGRHRVLVGGWLLGIPVPLLIAFAPTWEWIIAANVLLGLQQGLCWSTSIFMKVDVSGRRRSGTAIGINEFAGYGGTAVLAYQTGVVAASYTTEVAFLLGEAIVLAGLVMAWRFVDETVFFHGETGNAHTRIPGMAPRTGRAFASVSQAGFVTKLGDTTAWGLLPAYFTLQGLPLATVAILSAAYPASWSVLQPFTAPSATASADDSPAQWGCCCRPRASSWSQHRTVSKGGCSVW